MVDDIFIFEDTTKSACQPCDIIIIGTDGSNETRNKDEDIFGHKRLENIIRNHALDPARAIQDPIVGEVNAFRGDLDQEDDITLVVIKAT